MVDMSVREMLEAGVHFGHQTHRWDPRMKPFIFGSRNGVHIIDLQKTLPLFQEACQFITKTVAGGGDVLFVGTKRQAQPIIEEESKNAQMFHVSHRWLGGTLTNFRTIRASIDRLKDLEAKKEKGELEVLTKKERLMIEREIEKLTKSFGGIKEMNRLPAILFVIDPHNEAIALDEAARLHIPIVAIADTNCNPDNIDYLIPGNDDAIKSIRLLVSKVVQACQDGLGQRQSVLRENVERLEGSRDVSGSKGKAFVSKVESYDENTGGEYTGKRAQAEAVKEELV